MTREELEKEAEEFLGGWLIDHEIVKLLVDFAEPRENRITELEQQIEKMKQCGNCGNGTIGNCEHCKRKPKQKSTDTDDYWRLKEITEK